MNPLLDLRAHPVIGHRGASGLAPENTLESLKLALAQGADALEFDVHRSADGQAVVIHDDRLDRTTDATGPLRLKSAAELAALDAGYRYTGDGGRSFPFRGRGVGVPSLAEVLVELPRTPLLIELKTAEVAEPVRRVLLEHAAVERVVLASFLEEALTPFRSGGFHLGASRRGIARLWLGSKLGLPVAAGRYEAYAVPDRMRNGMEVPTPRFIKAARRAGCPVHVWTVDDPSQAATLWQRGVCGMVTNFPARILKVRNSLYGSAVP